MGTVINMKQLDSLYCSILYLSAYTISFVTKIPQSMHVCLLGIMGGPTGRSAYLYTRLYRLLLLNIVDPNVILPTSIFFATCNIFLANVIQTTVMWTCRVWPHSSAHSAQHIHHKSRMEAVLTVSLWLMFGWTIVWTILPMPEMYCKLQQKCFVYYSF